MIIASFLFFIGIFGFIIFKIKYYYDFKSKNIKEINGSKLNCWLYLIITVCSAQYIWG